MCLANVLKRSPTAGAAGAPAVKAGSPAQTRRVSGTPACSLRGPSPQSAAAARDSLGGDQGNGGDVI